MAKFSFNGNPAMPDSLFAEFIGTDKGLRAARFPIGYCDNRGVVKGYHVEFPTYNDSWDLTPAQMEQARAKFEQRRQEIAQQYQVPGVLFIVTMGADYSHKGDEVGNHRVRVRFFDNDGETVGAEFMPWSGGFHWDRWEISREARRSREYCEKMDALEKQYGNRIPYKLLPEFPSTYADRGVSDLPYTESGIIEWIKIEYNISFDRAYIDRYFFACDEYVSRGA